MKKLRIHDRRGCDQSSIDVNSSGAELKARIAVKRRGETKRTQTRKEIEAAEWLARAGGTVPDMEYIPRRQSDVSE